MTRDAALVILSILLSCQKTTAVNGYPFSRRNPRTVAKRLASEGQSCKASGLEKGAKRGDSHE